MDGLLLGTALLTAIWSQAVDDHRAPVPEAEALIQRGVALRRTGQDQEALEVFRRSNALHPSPKARAQMGMAEEALGRWLSAAQDLQEALRATQDAWITKSRPVLAGALATVREHLGDLLVLGTPAGAHVLINGVEIGGLPLKAPAPVVAGDALITVAADGYVAMSRKVVVPAGQLVRETVDLPPAPTATAIAAPTAATAPKLSGPPEKVEPVAVAATQPIEPPALDATAPRLPEPPVVVATGDSPRPFDFPVRYQRRAAWIAGAGGVAALLVAGVSGYLYRRDADTFNKMTSYCGTGSPNRGNGTGCAGLYDNLGTERTAFYTGLISAAVLAGVSGGLFWSSRDQQPGTRVSCVSTGRGGACAFTF